ncbi:MAG: polysaccharide deacetylase family protein [Anaerolineales bacterium]|nr:polysaccharide deacetylase family protein [Anaerolineales bacterium]
MKKKFIWITGILFLLACQTMQPIAYTPMKVPALLPTFETLPASPTIFSASVLPAPEILPTATPTLTATLEPSSTPTLAWIHQGPDAVTVPILLYHRIETPDHESYYYVPPEKFEEQMALLRNWGYTTITLDTLLTAIYQGADLPAHPLLITFDDGQESVYTAAFPIMQRYGFTGVVYIVGTYLDAPSFMTTEQVRELTWAGWEVGSHSMSHKDLTKLDYDQRKYEISKSRDLLSEKIGVPVNSFAYPWGFSGGDVISLVRDAGYTSAMGLGYTYQQGTWNTLLLQRRDVQGNYDLKKFASFLPWYGDSIFLPTDTPTPTPRPTRTPRPTKVK